MDFRLEWDHEPIEKLIAAAEAVDVDDRLPVVDVDHDGLRAPDDMLTAYTAALGSAIVQGIAIGRYASIDAARNQM